MNTNNAEEIVLDGEYPIDPIKQWRAGYRAGVEALREAAQSLEYIAKQAGRDELLTDLLQIRGYAHNRAECARALLRRLEGNGG